MLVLLIFLLLFLITIPLLISTSDEFHSERTSLSGFCHLTFWQLESLCMSSSLINICLSLILPKKEKKKRDCLQAWGNGWWERLFCSSKSGGTKLQIHSLIEGPSKILMLTVVWMRMAASLTWSCWYQHCNTALTTNRKLCFLSAPVRPVCT